jgi:hypothetical protein
VTKPAKLILIIGSISVLGFVLPLLSLYCRAERNATEIFRRQEQALEKSLIARTEELRARGIPRPRLFEPEIPGNGWPEYEQAVRELAHVNSEDTDAIQLFRESTPELVPDPLKLRTIFAKYNSSVEKLRQSYRYPAHVPPELFRIAPGSVDAVKLLRSQAAFLHWEGHDSEALEYILLAVALAEDAGRQGSFLECLTKEVCEYVAEDALQHILESCSATPAALELLARQLDRLSETRPGLLISIPTQDLAIRISILESANSRDAGPLGGGASWRSFYSRRLAYAPQVAEVEHLFARASQITQLPVHGRLAALTTLVGEPRIRENHALDQITENLARIFRTDACSQMQWSLMRLAVAVAWYQAETGQSPESLSHLVPRYLPGVPICSSTGMPFHYSGGKIRVPERDLKDKGLMRADLELTLWTVKRKP